MKERRTAYLNWKVLDQYSVVSYVHASFLPMLAIFALISLVVSIHQSLSMVDREKVPLKSAVVVVLAET